VENVKDTLDFRLQVRRHPWGMVAGSAALGCLGGYLLYRSGSVRPRTSDARSQPPYLEIPRSTAPPNGAAKGPRLVAEESGEKPVPEAAHHWSEPAWLSSARSQFEPEITRLKGLVIGTGLSAVRDTILRSVSEQIKPDLTEVMDSIMVKLGGEPTRGPEPSEQNQSARAGSLAARR